MSDDALTFIWSHTCPRCEFVVIGTDLELTFLGHIHLYVHTCEFVVIGTDL